MKEEHRKYAQEVYDIVNHASKNIGSRLPGTDNEKNLRPIWAISSER